MPRFEANPTPSLLVWARSTAGYRVELAAEKAKIEPDTLRAWEQGTAHPSFAQLKRLAEIYKRPLAALYLPDPPQRFQVMHDFRRITQSRVPLNESPELALDVRSAYDRREWALELATALEQPVPELAGSLSVNQLEESAGQVIRGLLRIGVAEQSKWRDPYTSLRHWRLRMEHAGLLTLQATEIELKEARGFSISLRPLPVVVANNKDAPRGRIFTLLHEFAHVLLNESGICDLHDEAVEAYCNRVAGAVLFPKAELLNSPTLSRHRKGETSWTDAELESISKQFGGSQEAALVRLLQLGLTTQRFYDEKRAEYWERYEENRKKNPGFAMPHEVNLASAGPYFTRLVMESLGQKKITASDVSDFLGIRVKHLNAAREFASLSA